MKLQQLLSYTRKAVDEYGMIQDGDHIAVGISGGKDSLTLLYAMHGLKRFYPHHFELSAVTVDLGYSECDFTPVAELCRELEVPYHIVKTDIAHILFEERKESNPCSLCAKMRKGALNQAVKEMQCNKVAYAHHKDDIIETMLLSLLFEGRFFSQKLSGSYGVDGDPSDHVCRGGRCDRIQEQVSASGCHKPLSH